MLSKLEIASVSHVGCVRTANQDYIGVSAQNGIVALADGMGGHQGGEVASEIAVGVSLEALRDTAIQSGMDTLQCLIRIGQAAETANTSVYSLSKKQDGLNGMGTTLVLLMFRDERVFFAHVGDSRLYRIRNGSLRQMTKDHSLLQEVLDRELFATVEEAADAGVGANVLTRSLGFSVDVNVDVSEASTLCDDYYLLCSDGLTGHVSDQEIADVVGLSDITLEEKVESLLNAALEAGGKDNVSLILVRVLAD